MNDHALAHFVREEIQQNQQQQHYPAKVIERVGTKLRVRRLGAVSTAEIEGPFPTRRGGAENARPGDIVEVDWSYGYGRVDGAFSGSDWANTMTLVGADKRVQETTSHTTWVELLRVGGLAIAATSLFDVHFHCAVEVVGGEGSTAKQLRLVFNDTESIGVTLSAGSGSFWAPWVGSAYSELQASRSLLLLAQDSGSPNIVGVGDITSISLQARTNDTDEGNDKVIAENLLVFA